MNKSTYSRAGLINLTEKYLPYLKLIVRIALSISTCSILLSSILVLLFGKINGDNYNENYIIFIWFAALYTMWTLFCCLPILLSIALYKKFTNKEVWTSIKKESILL